MPITYADLQPFINAGQIPQANIPTTSYAQTSNIPTTGGATTIRKPGGPDRFGPGFGDPLGSSLFGFGSTKPSWNPYQQNGLYYWKNPDSKNPVPVASVPGAGLKPSKTYQDYANNAQAMQDVLPYITNAINSQQLPTELSNLQTAQVTSPGYAQLMTQLYNNYGPALNSIGNEIQRQNAIAQAGTENQVLQGPGKDLVNNAYQLSQVYDKPYYDTRQTGADAISRLINSIDLSGKLSGSEMSQVGQGLARQNQVAGTSFAPSQTNTVANAMQYGQAGYQRKQQATSNLSDAISKASAFLPTAKSGVDVFQTATGRSSMPNTGNSLFPGINSGTASANSGYGLAGNLLGGMGSDTMNNNTIQSQQKDWLDKFVQLTQGVSNVAGSIGSIAGGIPKK